MNIHNRGGMSPTNESLDIRLRPPELPSPPSFRPAPRPIPIPLPDPLPMSPRAPLDLVDHPDQEPHRISFHEDDRDHDLRHTLGSRHGMGSRMGSRHSLSHSCKSG